jgi:hypothetical protein
MPKKARDNPMHRLPERAMGRIRQRRGPDGRFSETARGGIFSKRTIVV